MSTPVELSDLAQAIARYRFAYLLTSSAQGAPHAVAVVPALQDGVLVVDHVGRRTRENLLARPAVGLVWLPQSQADILLIVDGQAALDVDSCGITPTRVVLHRPARRARGPAPPVRRPRRARAAPIASQLPVPTVAGSIIARAKE